MGSPIHLPPQQPAVSARHTSLSNTGILVAPIHHKGIQGPRSPGRRIGFQLTEIRSRCRPVPFFKHSIKPRPVCPKLMRQTCQRATDCHQLGFRPAAQSPGSAAPLLSSMVAGAGCMIRASKGAELRAAGRAEIGRLARNSELRSARVQAQPRVLAGRPVSSRFPAGLAGFHPSTSGGDNERPPGRFPAGSGVSVKGGVAGWQGAYTRTHTCAHFYICACACACVGAAPAAHHSYSWGRNSFPVFPCRPCVPCVMGGRTFLSQSFLENNSLGSNMILTNGIPWSCIPCPLQPPWAHPATPCRMHSTPDSPFLGMPAAAPRCCIWDADAALSHALHACRHFCQLATNGQMPAMLAVPQGHKRSERGSKFFHACNPWQHACNPWQQPLTGSCNASTPWHLPCMPVATHWQMNPPPGMEHPCPAHSCSHNLPS